MDQKFSIATKADWLARVRQELKGKPIEELDFEVAGRVFTPFFHPEDQAERLAPVHPGRAPGWGVGQRILVGEDLAEANRQALIALERGANVLCFVRETIIPETDRKQLLKGVYVDMIEVIYEREIQQDLRLETDPITTLSKALARPVPTVWLATSDDYFLTVALLRACQKLLPESRLIAHVKNQPGRDEHTNKIAASTHALAAVIGGAEVVFIEPSDGFPGTTFSRRIALNLHHLLAEESHLGRVQDPAAGSYYVEELTDHLVRAARAEFKKMSA